MHSIRWKLIALTSLVVAVPIYFLNGKAVVAFNAFTSKAQEIEMISHARIIGEQYRVFVAEAESDHREKAESRFAALLASLGPTLQSRIRVLSQSGVVLFDSATESTVGMDLTHHAEVVGARTSGYGARWRLVRDEDLVYYYITVPVKDQDEVLAYVHVQRHTGPIIKAILTIQHDQRVALAVALIGAVLAAAVLAQTLTWRLRRLTRSARAFARGERLAAGVAGRDEIGELSAAMTRMEADLAVRNQYNRDFVATVMHELKAPLTAIKGAAEILDGTASEKPEARRKFLGNISYEVDRLIRMVGELSGLTQLDTDDGAQSHLPVDYAAWLRGFQARAETMFPGEHAEIAFDIPEGAYGIRGNPDHLEQVFVNLLENAIRYTPHDGRISVRLVPGKRDLVTTVSDTGTGITESNIDKVFNRFFTTEPKGRSTDYGTGLGLAVSRTIVERHRGTISVTSAEGVGTTFTITLPRMD